MLPPTAIENGDSEAEHLLEPGQGDHDHSKHSGFYNQPAEVRIRRILNISLATNAILLLAVLLGFVLGPGLHGNINCSSPPGSRHSQGGSTNGYGKDMPSYSPILDQVNLAPHFQRFNGRIHDNTTIFRQDPSPEVDDAWDRLSAEGFEIITVDEESVIRSGKTPGLSVKAPLSWDRGPQAYVAQVEVFHQVHCLNELRKEIHADYYYGSHNRSNKSSEELRADRMEHKKHCIHMLLQNLLCHADVEIITHNWVHYDLHDQPNRPYAEPFADFNVIKKCRNFEELLIWQKEKSIANLSSRWAELKMPDGAEFVSGDGYF